MDCYKDLYFYLFNQITNAIHTLESHDSNQALSILRNAQIQAEEAFISWDSSTDSKLIQFVMPK